MPNTSYHSRVVFLICRRSEIGEQEAGVEYQLEEVWDGKRWHVIQKIQPTRPSAAIGIASKLLITDTANLAIGSNFFMRETRWFVCVLCRASTLLTQDVYNHPKLNPETTTDLILLVLLCFISDEKPFVSFQIKNLYRRQRSKYRTYSQADSPSFSNQQRRRLRLQQKRRRRRPTSLFHRSPSTQTRIFSITTSPTTNSSFRSRENHPLAMLSRAEQRNDLLVL